MSDSANVDDHILDHVDTHNTPAPTVEEAQNEPIALDTSAPTVQAAAIPTAPQVQMINLKVLSPAFDISEGFNVGSVAVDMTVGALKQKICDMVHTHPPPNHQRLIYCGHVLANDTDTLAKVFGPSNIQHQSDFTIHLVVRPQLHAPSATNTPNPASRAHTPSAPSLPNSSSPAPPSTNATSTPTVNPTTNNTAPPPPPRRVGPSPPFPHIPRVPGMPPTGQMPPMGMGLPDFIPPHFPGMQPAGTNPATPGQTHQIPQNQGIPGVPGLPGLPGLPGIPGTGTTTTRTVNGPNGTQYTVRVTNSTVALHPQQHMPGQQHMFPHHQMLPHQHMQPQHPSFFAPPPFPHMSLPTQNTNTSRPTPADINMNDAFDDPVTANDVRELAELTSQFAQLMQAESGISEQARAAAQTLRTNTDTIATRLRASAGRHATRNAAQRNAPVRGAAQQNSSPTTVQSPSPSAQAQQQSTHMQQFDATAATVYLLSSPGGPQALLFAPQGTYTGQPQHMYNMNPVAQLPHGYGPMPGMQFPHSVHLTNGQPQDITQQPQQPAAAVGVAGLPNPPLNPAHPNEAVLQIAGQQVVQELVRDHNVVERQNQPVDLLQQWQPLLAQFWLLFRVILFAYFFFPTDQGWYRPLAMALISVVFYFVNGDGAGRRIRDAIRGWWEGVIGIPARREGQQEQQQQAQAQAPQGQAPVPDGAQQQTQAAAPQVAQPPPQQQELHWLRQTLRPAERALALFLASLWPGIGERAGAARREEEERQRRAEQERIVQEEAQRREADEAATAAIADHAEGERADAALSTEAAPSQEQDIVPTATVATGADVASGADDALRARKPVSPRAATVEEEDGKEVDSAATTHTPSTTE